MKEQGRLFEPITERQINKINELAGKHFGLSDEAFITMLSDWIGIPDITALSKWEASHVIERFYGPIRWTKPRPSRTADWIGGDTSCLPSIRQIHFIRQSVKNLGWPLPRFRDWLYDLSGVTTIRDLKQNQAHKLCQALIYLLKERN